MLKIWFIILHISGQFLIKIVIFIEMLKYRYYINFSFISIAITKLKSN